MRAGRVLPLMLVLLLGCLIGAALSYVLLVTALAVGTGPGGMMPGVWL
jgi:hypothetical protein